MTLTHFFLSKYLQNPSALSIHLHSSMELHIPLFAILFLLMIIKTMKRPKPTKLPPSPWKIPLVGNLHQLAASGSLVHRTLTLLAKKHGHIMYLQLGQVPVVVVSSPETAREVLKDNDLNFSNRPNSLIASKTMTYNFTDIVFSPYGKHWRTLRKICMTYLLSQSRVQSFRSVREEEVSGLIRDVNSCRGSPINLSNVIFSMICGVTARVTFGSRSEELDRFVYVTTEAVKLAGGFRLADLYPSIKVLEMISGLRHKVEKLHQESDKTLDNIIKQRREREMGLKNGGKDLVDVLLEVQARNDFETPLSDNNVKALIFDMFSGGNDTTFITIEWAMSEMLKNPEVMKKAQTEVRQVFHEKGNLDETVVHKLQFLKAVIKETLRLHPPIPLPPRKCQEDCVISGYEIPAKTKVIVNVWAIGRDPKYWTEPERFYPERFLESTVDYKGTQFQFIPFGSGRRICPAIAFALPIVELSLAKLLYHFDWKLGNGQRLEHLNMTEAFGLNVRRKHDLFLIPTLYRPSYMSELLL